MSQGTPRNPTRIEPKKLFKGRRKITHKESPEDRNRINKINNDIEEMNLEILLLNTRIISVTKSSNINR